MLCEHAKRNNPLNNHPKFKNLSDWIIIDDYCATRIIKGGKADNISNRVAFIEKSPRVRVNKNKLCMENNHSCAISDAWLYGSRGSSDYGRDIESRKWCDDMLKLLGWE